MGHQSIVSEFVNAAIEDMRRHDSLRHPDPHMPMEMRDLSAQPIDDWIAWRPIPSTVTDQDIEDIQNHFRGPLPSPYIAFLKYVHFYGLTECGVRFEPHIVGRWKKRLIDLHDRCQRVFPKGSHLIPFGHETLMDAGPVCFDFNNRNQDSDCPIVFWDHEWVHTDKEIRPLFSSSAKMFEFLLSITRSQIDFRELPEAFLKIDPVGASGPARDYWNCWARTPQDAK